MGHRRGGADLTNGLKRLRCELGKSKGGEEMVGRVVAEWKRGLREEVERANLQKSP